MCKNVWNDFSIGVTSESTTPSVNISFFSNWVDSTFGNSTGGTIYVGDGYSIDSVGNNIILTGTIYKIVFYTRYDLSSTTYTVTVTNETTGEAIESLSGTLQNDYTYPYNHYPTLLTVTSLSGKYLLPGNQKTYHFTSASIIVNVFSNAVRFAGYRMHASRDNYDEERTGSIYYDGITEAVKLSFGSRSIDVVESLDPNAYPDSQVAANGHYYIKFAAIASNPLSRSRYVSGTSAGSNTLRIFNPYGYLLLITLNIFIIGIPSVGFFRFVNSAYPTKITLDVTTDDSGNAFVSIPTDVASATEMNWINFL